MSLNPPPPNQNETSLQPFETLPDELLLSIFQCLDPLKRSLPLSICKKWTDTLLINRSLWTLLHLPRAFSFEESISILQIFSARSGFRLKHVIFEAGITNGQQLGDVFDELKKSAESLRLISLTQSAFLNKETRTSTRKLFPKLNTLNLLIPEEYNPFMIPNMLRLRTERGIQDADEELRYLRCTYFFGFEEAEREWLSGLFFFQTDGASFEDVRLVLKSSQFTLRHLGLLDWFVRVDDSPSPGEVDMKRLKYLEVPFRDAEARSLSQLLRRGESIEMLEGKVNTVIHFNFFDVKRLTICLCDEELDRENLENLELLRLRTESLFKQNRAEELVLECPKTTTGGETHLNLVLELLCNHSERQSRPEIHLPNLARLTIANPVKLDGKLLIKLVQERKSPTASFEVTFVDACGKELSINDWEARGWMD